MTRPTEPVPTPSVAVWRNELGDVTFAIDGGAEYVKVAPHGLDADHPARRLVPRADSAAAEWALRYNYEGDWRDEFFDAYGVAPDQDRMDRYLRLWEEGD